MSAILATFVKLSTMADGTPRIVLDLQCPLSVIAEMGLIPGVPFGLARITKEAAVTPPAPVEAVGTEKPKGGDLARMAGVFCNDPWFWEFCNDKFILSPVVTCAGDATDLVRHMCLVKSRVELDYDAKAAERFHNLFRIPFLAWKEAQQ